MALSLSETKNILKLLDVRPKRKWGQNFLIEPKVIQRSIEWAQLSPHETIIEVGPGCGTLTESLLAAQAHVFSVEKEAAFAQYLSQKFSTNTNFHIIRGDALEHPLGSFDGSKPYKIVANLPYAIASIWLDLMLEQLHLPDRMLLLVQKEAAERWLAKQGTKHFSALSISLQAAYTLQQKCMVNKRCFYPQPKVDSVLLCLQKRSDGWIFSKTFKIWMREIFLYRRKQLAHVCKNTDFSKNFLDFLEQNGFTKTLRAEAIPLKIWIEFAKQVQQETTVIV